MPRRRFLRLMMLAFASMTTLTAANCEKGQWDSNRGAFVWRSKEGRN
jgi:hypothetical protein